MSNFFFQPNGTGGGSGGLVQESQTIANNTTGNVSVLLYDKLISRGANVNYLVDRGTDTSANKVQQISTLLIRYDSNTDDWFISEGIIQGDAGVTFAINNSGQVSYTSSNLSGANYYGNIYFYNEQIDL